MSSRRIVWSFLKVDDGNIDAVVGWKKSYWYGGRMGFRFVRLSVGKKLKGKGTAEDGV